MLQWPLLEQSILDAFNSTVRRVHMLLQCVGLCTCFNWIWMSLHHFFFFFQKTVCQLLGLVKHMVPCYRRQVLGELLLGWTGEPCSDRYMCLCVVTVELIIQRFKMKLFFEMCSISKVINEAVDLLLSSFFPLCIIFSYHILT